MTRIRDMSKSTRRSVLAVIMMGVLLLMVVAAWLVVRAPAERAREAERMLHQLRDRPMDELFGRGGSLDWYLIRQGGEPAGWMARAVGRGDDGSAIGVRVEAHANQVLDSQEQWRLEAGLTAGQYEASLRTPRVQLRTRIEQADGQVAVLTQGTWAGRATGSAPPNYMPEGLFLPVLREVARTGADVQFKIVFNTEQGESRTVVFNTSRLRYVDRVSGPDGAEVSRVRVSGVRTSGHRLIYEVAADGQVRRVIQEGAGLRFELTDVREIARRYPGAVPTMARSLPAAIRQAVGRLLIEGSAAPEPVGAAEELGV